MGLFQHHILHCLAGQKCGPSLSSRIGGASAHRSRVHVHPWAPYRSHPLTSTAPIIIIPTVSVTPLGGSASRTQFLNQAAAVYRGACCTCER
ncbi:unnamed protein product [Ectocarpus fasciculatus]